MVEYRIPGAEFVSTALIVVCCLIAVIAITRRAEGRSRHCGVAGIAALAASMVLDAVNRSQASVYGTDTTAFGVLVAIVALLAAAAPVLLALGVVLARRAPRPRGGRR